MRGLMGVPGMGDAGGAGAPPSSFSLPSDQDNLTNARQFWSTMQGDIDANDLAGAQSDYDSGFSYYRQILNYNLVDPLTGLTAAQLQTNAYNALQAAAASAASASAAPTSSDKPVAGIDVAAPLTSQARALVAQSLGLKGLQLAQVQAIGGQITGNANALLGQLDSYQPWTSTAWNFDDSQTIRQNLQTAMTNVNTALSAAAQANPAAPGAAAVIDQVGTRPGWQMNTAASNPGVWTLFGQNVPGAVADQAKAMAKDVAGSVIGSTGILSSLWSTIKWPLAIGVSGYVGLKIVNAYATHERAREISAA